jgi:hypothetical protein
MSEPSFRWSSFDRVVVTSARTAPTPADLDALAAVMTAVATRVGRRVLFVQVSTISGGVAVHAVGKGTATAFGRYAAAMRAHVEEVHAVAGGGGALGGMMRSLVSAVTKFGSSPSIMHADVATLVEDLRRRHGIDPAALRDAIERTRLET